jgi:hypothetical protein
MKLEHIPAHVLNTLRNAGYKDETLLQNTAEELFKKYCDWHGLLNWHYTLWNIVIELKKAQEKEKEDRRIR